MPHPARRPAYYKKLLRTMLLTFLVPAVIATGILCAFQVRREIQRARQEQSVDAARLMSVLSGQLDTAAQMAFHCANDSFIVSLSKREYDVLALRSSAPICARSRRPTPTLRISWSTMPGIR